MIRGVEAIEAVLDRRQLLVCQRLDDVAHRAALGVERAPIDLAEVGDRAPVHLFPTTHSIRASIRQQVGIPLVAHLGREQRLEREKLVPVAGY